MLWKEPPVVTRFENAKLLALEQERQEQLSQTLRLHLHHSLWVAEEDEIALRPITELRPYPILSQEAYYDLGSLLELSRQTMLQISSGRPVTLAALFSDLAALQPPKEVKMFVTRRGQLQFIITALRSTKSLSHLERTSLVFWLTLMELQDWVAQRIYLEGSTLVAILRYGKAVQLGSELVYRGMAFLHEYHGRTKEQVCPVWIFPEPECYLPATDLLSVAVEDYLSMTAHGQVDMFGVFSRFRSAGFSGEEMKFSAWGSIPIEEKEAINWLLAQGYSREMVIDTLSHKLITTGPLTPLSLMKFASRDLPWEEHPAGCFLPMTRLIYS